MNAAHWEPVWRALESRLLEDRSLRFFNLDAVIQGVSAAASSQDVGAGPSLELWASYQVATEEARSKWQASREALFLGLALLALVLTPLAMAALPLFSGASLLSIPFRYWLWGAVGGTVMGMHRFTHHWAARTLQRTATWQSLTKALTGAILGAAAVELLQAGLGSLASPHGAVPVALGSIVAFAAGFRERWFLQWLSRLRPEGSVRGVTSS